MALKFGLDISDGNVKVWKGMWEEAGEVRIANGGISHAILSECYTSLIKGYVFTV
jgi:hypothetical protein